MIWRKVALGEVVALQRGYDLPEQDRRPGVFPIVGSAGPNGSHDRANVSGPGVVLGRSGAGFGSAHYCEGDFWALNTGLFVSDFRGNDPRFVFYLLDHLDFTEYNSGGAQPSLNRNFIYPISVYLPPLQEQVNIARALSIWDTAIEKTERLIVSKRIQFTGLVRKMVIRRAKTEASWKYRSIHTIAERVQRQTDGNDYPLLTISSTSGFVRQEEKYSRYMAGESAKSYTLLRIGEFAYNKGNSLRYQFGCVFQLQNYEAALVPHVYVCFRLKDSVHAGYMRHLFIADYLKPQLGALVKTGVRNNGLLNIRPDEFMGVTVPIPPLEEQKRITVLLDAAEREIRLLTQRLNAYRKQKRGLMQKLLPGQWRVKTSEEVAECPI